jgi:hypothetical protein
MVSPQKERWEQLCAQVQVEEDPSKISELVAEISKLLKEKEARFKGHKDSTEKTSPTV